MKIPLLLAVSIAAAASAACAQNYELSLAWQRLNNPTATQVLAKWQSPPSEYGPEPYYGLNGPVTLETVQRDLDTMHSLGFRAVTVQYGYGSEMAYMSAEYMRFFRQFVLEAKKRDMRIWIVDDAGYPSGFAGGKFSSERPEMRMQALVAAAPIQVAGSTVFDELVGPETVALSAIEQTSGEVIQVPFSDGHAHWTAPAGEWTVTRVDHVFRTSPTRSDTNPKRVKDGEQSLEDYLDPAATAQYLAFTHEQYKRSVGDEFGKTILGFRGDEPDYSIAGLPWTPKFFARFQTVKGYDIRPFVAAFLQPRDKTLAPRQLRARADYYDVFAQMFRDGFFRPQAEWCAANGLEYQVHLNHEEAQLQLAHSEGDFFRDMRYVQIPGIDSIWHQIWTDTISDFPRFASSAAHVYGHPRAFTESFAAYRPQPDLAMARYILNEQFVRGVNLVETMYFPASSTPGRGGPSALMQDPGYPALMAYISRVSYLMSQGHPAADVALLLPAESLWMGDTNADALFVSTERLLSEQQIDFDIVDEDAIGTILPLEHGAFLSQSGNRYRAVLVPGADLLPASVFGRLQEFSRGGGHVLFLGKAPSLVGTATSLDARPVNSTDVSWATVMEAELPVVPTPPAQPPAGPPAKFDVPSDLVARLRNKLRPQSLSLIEPEPALRVIARTLKDATCFFIFNESGKALHNQITLRSAGTRIEIWDAQTGTTQPELRAIHRQEGLSLPLNLRPYEVEIVVIR